MLAQASVEAIYEVTWVASIGGSVVGSGTLRPDPIAATFPVTVKAYQAVIR